MVETDINARYHQYIKESSSMEITQFRSKTTNCGMIGSRFKDHLTIQTTICTLQIEYYQYINLNMDQKEEFKQQIIDIDATECNSIELES